MALALSALERAQPGARLRRSIRSPKPVFTSPRLTVVIVNYCLWEETEQLVRQLLSEPATQRGEVELIVVDNHSPPHPIAKKLRRWPGVSLRRWGRNRGFAHAVNEGSRLSRGNWILVLNPDITLSPGFLDGALRLAQRIEKDEPRAGVVGFQLRNNDGSRQLSSGPFPTLVETVARLVLPRCRRKYHFLPARRRRPVPWVTGCCLLARRTCLEDLGGLDGDYFLYYEDVDLCRRAQDQGWTVWYEPGLIVTHHHPLHSRTVPPHIRLLTRHAFLTYASKHWPKWQFRILAGMVEFEARFRKHWADQRNDLHEVGLFAKLQAIARDLAQGDAASARRHLEQVVRREERNRGA
jgi:N-acetylglucosaminyl-diphospho-decaprenol L-rhamnosyltransferase